MTTFLILVAVACFAAAIWSFSARADKFQEWKMIEKFPAGKYLTGLSSLTSTLAAGAGVECAVAPDRFIFFRGAGVELGSIRREDVEGVDVESKPGGSAYHLVIRLRAAGPAGANRVVFEHEHALAKQMANLAANNIRKYLPVTAEAGAGERSIRAPAVADSFVRIQQLEKLAELRDGGHLTEAEYEREKQRVLGYSS